MKYLNDYLQGKITNIEKKYGAFYAFNKTQFQEGCGKVGASEKNKVTRLKYGLFVLSKNTDNFLNDFDKAHAQAVQQDINDNGKKAIIWRELANHECQINIDPQPCIDYLEIYPITEQEIRKEFPTYMEYCIENDLF